MLELDAERPEEVLDPRSAHLVARRAPERAARSARPDAESCEREDAKRAIAGVGAHCTEQATDANRDVVAVEVDECSLDEFLALVLVAPVQAIMLLTKVASRRRYGISRRDPRVQL